MNKQTVQYRKIKNEKDQKKLYKRRIKEQKKLIRQLQLKIDSLTKEMENEPKLKIVKNEKTTKNIDKKQELKEKLKEQFSGLESMEEAVG
jgi:hypothetical protein